jgi:hypothetical protein
MMGRTLLEREIDDLSAHGDLELERWSMADDRAPRRATRDRGGLSARA